MTGPLIAAWFEKGADLPVPGTAASRIWREGQGPPVVCLHGMPASAWLYRKMLPALARRGQEGVAFDLPGMGLAERPTEFDYSWTGLSGWVEKAIDAAGIGDFHLVVHDIAGPIGFDLVRRVPQRILTLTVLDTLVYASRFRRPLVMRPFGKPVIGMLWVAAMDSPFVYPMFRWKGALPGPSYAEIRAYGELIARGDRGRAFNRIMSLFENNAEFEARILPTLRDRSFPAQVIWGRHDTDLTLEDKGPDLEEALRLKTGIFLVDGKHFPQENAYEEIAERIALLVATGEDI